MISRFSLVNEYFAIGTGTVNLQKFFVSSNAAFYIASSLKNQGDEGSVVKNFLTTEKLEYSFSKN